MPDSSEINYQEWMGKAKEDELAIKSVLEHRDAPASIACFHSQQMAEKFLKGLLVFYDKKFSKIHDLIELESLLIETTPDIKDFHSDFKLLNRYYIETRYPGDYPEFIWQEAEAAYESAKKIKEFVLEKIKGR